MKTYHLSLERNGHDSGFVKLALCILEVDDKSSFSMSGHAGPLEALVYQILRIRPTSSLRVLGFTATDSTLSVLFSFTCTSYVRTLNTRLCTMSTGCSCIVWLAFSVTECMRYPTKPSVIICITTYCVV